MLPFFCFLVCRRPKRQAVLAARLRILAWLDTSIFQFANKWSVSLKSRTPVIVWMSNHPRQALQRKSHHPPRFGRRLHFLLRCWLLRQRRWHLLSRSIGRRKEKKGSHRPRLYRGEDDKPFFLRAHHFSIAEMGWARKSLVGFEVNALRAESFSRDTFVSFAPLLYKV